MFKCWKLTAGCLLLCGVLAAPVAAAPREVEWRGSGGWGGGHPYALGFNKAATVKVSGEVMRLERVTPLPGMSDGYALLLKTRDETLQVDLGPAWYLERQDFSLEVRDAVTVSGARVRIGGRHVIMATSVAKRDKLLLLREADGLPLWSSWRQQSN
jgi:hypothetical protein